jgi:hypothetical protein
MSRLAAQGVTTVINAACEVSDRNLCERYSLGYYHLYWYDDQQTKSAHQFLQVLGGVGNEEAKLASEGRTLRL